MYTTSIGNRPINFCGIKKVVSNVLATANDLKITAVYAKKSNPLYINFDIFTTETKSIPQKPLYKKVIQLISGKGKVVGTHNQFPDGSYDGVRIFKDGTRFDYSTFKHKTAHDKEKIGVKLDITTKNKHKYTVQNDEAYKPNGKINIPTIKFIQKTSKRNHTDFIKNHAEEIKNLEITY